MKPMVSLVNCADAGVDAAGAELAQHRWAELPPPGPSRARVAARAAYLGAAVGGDLDGVAPHLGPDRGGSLWATAARAYHLVHADGDLDAAHQVLLDGLAAAGIEDSNQPGALAAAFDTLAMTCRLAERSEFWLSLRTLANRQDVRVPRRMTPPASGQALDPPATVRAGWTALSLDALAPMRPSLHRVLDDGRQGGAAGSAINAAVLLAYDAFTNGRWDESLTLVRQATALCAAHGHTTLAVLARQVTAMVAAGRGDDDSCQRLTSQAIGWAAPRGARLVHQHAAHARALAALGRGDAETAYYQACRVAPVGAAQRDGHSRLLVMDLVEAALRSGRPQEAIHHVRAAQDAGIAGVSTRSALIVSGAAAMAERGGTACARYEEALELPGAETFPFEIARVRLAYGEHLRRARATLAARLQLTAALATFRGLEANPWIMRAESELRAAGHRTPRTRGPAATTLSHQERTVAAIAATGATNRQIGERLGLSPRTVGSHLSRAFWKLGVPSRAALGEALRLAENPTGNGSGQQMHNDILVT